ncbi:MAG TPA: pyridoxal phosphate-dependent aminotransferase [Spirochaetia bacterium]|nr:pyridoxal phosphate-dependent aminotransferase [Spirochaetia bacterium]
MRLSIRAINISPSATMAIDARAKAMAAAGVNVVNFGAGEPDFDTPEHIKAAAVEALRRGQTKYTPVAGTERLRQAIADKLQKDNNLSYPASGIVVSCGAKHSLYNAIQVLCQEGDEVILPVPYWVSYLEQIKLAGAVPVPVATGSTFKLTPGRLERACSDRTRLVIINSPNNPSGTVYTGEELAALAGTIVDRGLAAISDEIYEKLVYDGREHVSLAALGAAIKERTVTINGLSKAYAMTGWRIGYAAAPPAVARAMVDLQGHSTSNPTSIAQAAAVAALEGTQEPTRQMVAAFAQRRDLMLERLNAIGGLSCHVPGGAFYLFVSVESFFGKTFGGQVIACAGDLAEILLEEGRVAVVPGEAFGDPGCIRLSYATSADLIGEGVKRMAALLAKVV